MDPVIFFGNERLATGVTTDTPVLRALISAGYDVRAVVTNQHETSSRRNRTLEVNEVAQQNQIQVLSPSSPVDVVAQLRAYGARIGILVAYGRIVPQSIIDMFPLGIINIHPSLLPLHRGPTPIESVILSGELATGVTIMQLEKGMDSGPLWAQEKIDLSGRESKQELSDRLSNLGSRMLIEQLPGILRRDTAPTAQDDNLATTDKLIIKTDGQINWQLPAKQIERQIRAYLNWPGSSTKLYGREVIITSSHVEEKDEICPANKCIHVNTSEGCLVVDRLKPAGKSEMTASQFLAGLR